MANKGDTAPIRLGMVGGGNEAFIGAVHRIAARLDGEYHPDRGRAVIDAGTGARLGGRLWGWTRRGPMTTSRRWPRREARLKDGIEAVSIVTPNHMHAPVAREFLKRGIHVICDKPLTATLAEARKLVRGGRRRGRAVRADA